MLIPSSDDLWFLPLGGTGEIGMNLNLYGHDGKWLMIDCGISFDEPLVPSYRNGGENVKALHSVVAPDPTFIADQKEHLVGIVITHAHEDHIGALPYLWERFKCPVYTTPFTAEVLRRKLSRSKNANKVPIVEVQGGSIQTLGPFTLQWLEITHSIPEPYAIRIDTPVGSVLHTADWKIDAQPVTGKPFDHSAFRRLASEDILALIGDSTNANKPGFSLSERNCFDGLLNTIKPINGRVVVTCFASNVARLISLAKVAQKTGRYLGLFGRSLLNMYAIAKYRNLWPDDLTIVEPGHLGYLPPEEVMMVVTGSQGEPRAALARMAADTHHQVELTKGDVVIYSSIVIPGNETAVNKVNRALAAKGVSVLHSEQSPLPIHASGHPCEEELKLMYQWVQPEIAIPVHGEKAHLTAHAEIAKACGVKKHYVGQNGDLYRLAPQPSIRRQQVSTGRIPIQQN
ncbi:ribonuclease J [Alteromonas sp. KUL49]|uniref:ribonuclease J n=1 Tax=Alteromonas sp. KUL49 TaxID=2480798 RepID=UPI00102F09C9|nr:ribonuclease J [Alteromonas sp. KUL49]TAP37373.1 ribonuclease J [Alteromonas sp. KUL49]GEA13008.1 MBL fold hydrolase [Alteromonas sp. KUL49]